MAGNNYPWRDIYSNAEWSEIKMAAVEQIGPGVAATSVGGHKLGALATQVLAHLDTLLDDYHDIRKDDFEQFPARRRALREIAFAAEEYLRRLGTARQTKQAGTHKELDTGSSPLDIWVNSLAKRARKKAEYLRVMKVFHDPFSPLKQKFWLAPDLAAFLVTPTAATRNALRFPRAVGTHADYTTKGANMEYLRLSPYGQMEKLDPYHRNISFETTENTFDIPADRGVQPMAEALRDYLVSAGASADGVAAMDLSPRRNKEPTFYEWLEYHPICTTSPGLGVYSKGFEQKYKTHVRRVQYNAADIQTLVVSPFGLSVMTGGFPYEADTTGMTSKHKAGHAAIVWSKDGRLLIHRHGGWFVHSCFTGGKSVRCAGTIKIVMGTVTEITDDSGHYRPHHRHMYRFMKYLKENADVAADAKAVVGGGFANGSAGSFNSFLAAYPGTYPTLDPIWS
jgi:hypothetical protein